MLKKCKVVMLPTNEKATFNFGDMIKHITNEKLIISGFKSKENNPFDSLWNAQHLYIISDDEFKEDEWVYLNGKAMKATSKLVEAQSNFSRRDWKKIIATTDNSLLQHVGNDIRGREYDTQYQLPKPSQQFIQKYVEEYNKGNIIIDVLVEYVDNGEEDWIGDDYTGEPFWNEKIEPKINSKDNTITIKKLKESYTRQEVIELCKHAWQVGFNEGNYDETEPSYQNSDDWIEENLN